MNLEDLSDREIEAVLQTPAFRKALKYRRLAEGIEVMEDDDAIKQQLVATITQQHSTVNTQGSVEEVLDLFVEEIKTWTEGMALETDEDEQNPPERLEEIFVDEDGGHDE